MGERHRSSLADRDARVQPDAAACGRSAALAAWLAMLLLAGGCAPALEQRAPASPPGAGLHVWLVGHGWHVGLVVERAHIPAGRWPESRLRGEPAYLEVGWGDADYYPASRGTTALALQAAFRSRASVLHVVGFDAPVDAFFAASEVVEIAVSAEGLGALADFVHRTYARDGAGQPIVVGPALYGRGWFYAATGRYRLLDNSNTWTARALRAAGCSIDPARTPTAGALLEAARGLGRIIRGPRAVATAPAPAGTEVGRDPRCDRHPAR